MNQASTRFVLHFDLARSGAMLRVVLLVMAACLVSLVALSAQAQSATPVPQAGCDKRLLESKLKAAAGDGFQAVSANLRAGTLECAWMRRGSGSFATVSVQYYDAQAVAIRPNVTNNQFYDELTAPLDSKTKPEPLPGIGKRAALVPADPQRLIIVERDDGFYRIVMNGLSRAQAVSVAKAVGAP
jgi:hypothetical protein